MHPGKRRFYHSVRFKLLLVSLTLLGIPWAGYRLILETETLLRQQQDQNLTALTQAIALSLAPQAEAFGRPVASGTRYPNRDIYLHRLRKPPVLDGYRDDWTDIGDNAVPLTGTHPELSAKLHVGIYRGILYLRLAVKDAKVTYRKTPRIHPTRSDRVTLYWTGTDGRIQRWLISPFAPGKVRAAPIINTPNGPVAGPESNDIQGVWQEAKDGYTLELRLPARQTLGHFALRVDDIDTPGDPDSLSTLATSDTTRTRAIGRLVSSSPDLRKLLLSIARPDLRLRVVNGSGLVLAQVGELDESSRPLYADSDQVPWILHAAVSRILQHQANDKGVIATNLSRLDIPEVREALRGRPAIHRRSPPGSDTLVVSAAAPVRGANGIVGAVLVEQTSSMILSLQNLALQRIAGVTLAVFAAMTLALLGFATLLTSRIRKLRNELEAAVTADGRIIGEVTAPKRRDEIGDLGRSFSSVLSRLHEYNAYLEAMASRLAHELRTPLSVVRTSLDNCEQVAEESDRRRYLNRARDGAERLDLILYRLREATRLEQSLAQVETVDFDLCDLLHHHLENLYSVHSHIDLELSGCTEPAAMHGAPDLIAQAMDKLIGNALDFHTPGTPIKVRVAREGRQFAVTVRNSGPSLPPDLDPFQSMVSVRQGQTEQPHLGLGLFLVRLIAEYHDGTTTARNIDDEGVEIEMMLSETVRGQPG